MASFKLENMIHVPSSEFYHQFSYKQLENTLDAEMCKIDCVFDLDCHYSTFNPDNKICQLGSFSRPYGGSFGQFGIRETFIHPQYVTEIEEKYKPFDSPNSVWPKRITKKLENVETETHCAAICAVYNPICNLYLHQSAQKICLMGQLAGSHSVEPTSNEGTTTIKWRESTH